MSNQENSENNKEPVEDNYVDEEDEKDDATRLAEENAAREAAKKRCYKYSDPPKIYTDVKVSFVVLLFLSIQIEFVKLTICYWSETVPKIQ